MASNKSSPSAAVQAMAATWIKDHGLDPLDIDTDGFTVAHHAARENRVDVLIHVKK